MLYQVVNEAFNNVVRHAHTTRCEVRFTTTPDHLVAAAAIVEFMLGTLLENPHRLGGALQREPAGLRSARRGVYRVIYEVDETEHLVIVHRIEHRATSYRPR